MSDRTLAHVEAVVSSKLRRGESFMLTAATSAHEGSGRTTIWVNAASNLAYRYRRDRPALDRTWLEELRTSANSPGGMHLPEER
ncbi:hypothetical protein [Microbacterium dauci]|uniref:DUF7882 domain-containing protein n=1 Tax=Microbacterium dauci TaxID=3048008 RepID=A0ABT6ZFP0_9MICO|nr:hypothetical protein [Microbacterium sp. LX3-4]MDJ1114748.1 hypothetical protein [Microbacterium sp. LX3-4]